MKTTTVGIRMIRTYMLPAPIACKCKDNCKGLWFQTGVRGEDPKNFHQLHEALERHNGLVNFYKILGQMTGTP